MCPSTSASPETAVHSNTVAEEPISAEQWWIQNELLWRRTPDYFENLRSKAERHGKEWVRQNKRPIDAYWDNAANLYRAQEFIRDHGSLDDF